MIRVPPGRPGSALVVLALALPACAAADPEVDAFCGQGSPDAGTPFACKVVSFSPGPSSGFGEEAFVYGAPEGAGTSKGGVDVLSLGVGGEIVVAMGSPIVDVPGPDLIVFENPFYVNDDPEKPYKELAVVGVSEDGETFVDFECLPAEYETSSCAGWRPVLSSPDNAIPPTDPSQAGGDPFDLAEVGLAEARYVRVRDLSIAGGANNAGFDLDAIAIVTP